MNAFPKNREPLVSGANNFEGLADCFSLGSVAALVGVLRFEVSLGRNNISGDNHWWLDLTADDCRATISL